ncbi:helix-turn-helix domain-containing protein [Chthonobacter rhizosphaerae]|uniref:helix-turn-helix domain-containing protein n=1 Tax=Chthonobacter rhizosphaerae TaxID=2735553 RepID=UPI001AEDD49A|nr:helix-turn-helix domain-containing protein [Chthonobacter rhizosphaerae]
MTDAMQRKAGDAVMTPQAFRQWRKSLGLRQKDAAERLGLKKRMIQYYESGDRDGKTVEIPLSVRLACWALACGVIDFDGQRELPSDGAGAAAGAAGSAGD